MFLPTPNLPDNPYGAFGADLLRLLPPDMPPDEFRDMANPWHRIVAGWFHRGLPEGTWFIAKAGVDPEATYRHLSLLLRSWEIDHNDKIATVSYLMSLWLEEVRFPKGELQKVSTIGHVPS